MARFIVLVTRDCTESTSVAIEAASEAEAMGKALEVARTVPWRFAWAPDECSGLQSEPYATGCTSADGESDQ